MEQALIGADIMPAAAHFTAMMLSAAHPDRIFKECGIHVVEYGLTKEGKKLVKQCTHNKVLNLENKLKKGHVRVGSLELLDSDQTRSMVGHKSTQLAGTAEQVQSHSAQFLLDAGSVDLIIMNPPYVRPTGHEADKVGVPVPSVAGMSTPDFAQKVMGAKIVGLSSGKDKAGDGNAGLGSNFLDLAHNKLAPGGVLALVLPATVINGSSWKRARQVICNNYQDVLVVTIANVSSSESRAFSADTGMAEALIVATKASDAQNGTKRTTRAVYVSLHRRPASLLEALETARAIRNTRAASHPKILSIASESSRGRRTRQEIGWLMEAEFVPEARGHPAGVINRPVATTAQSMTAGTLNLPPQSKKSPPVPLVRLETLGRRGWYHIDINGKPEGSSQRPRGPFEPPPKKPKGEADNRSNWKSFERPTLWWHNHKQEKRMTVLPDLDGEPRSWSPEGDDTGASQLPGTEDFAESDSKHKPKRTADEIWQGTKNTAGATRLHINRDFRINSQPLGACLTPDPAIGGRAWPSFGVTPPPCHPDCPQGMCERCDARRHEREKALCVWLNTTPGLIGRWWVSVREQKGRANLAITTIGLIPVPDLKTLPKEKVEALAKVFDDYADTKLKPANEANKDDGRKALDKAVLCEALGLPKEALDNLAKRRHQWCNEPSVHGGKKAKTKKAKTK